MQYITNAQSSSISIHAPREGSDHAAYAAHPTRTTFQSTLPARGATRSCGPRAPRSAFQSTLPARGATGSDGYNYASYSFQSTLPARGATAPGEILNPLIFAFQSTLPARGATRQDLFILPDDFAFQSTLPARGATRRRFPPPSCGAYFNPRSPRGERRVKICLSCPMILHFNPRSPRGERLAVDFLHHLAGLISIHAPREGSDLMLVIFRVLQRFQSTLPARGATPTRSHQFDAASFQSTLPARGATFTEHKSGYSRVISIHAPREGSDC